MFLNLVAIFLFRFLLDVQIVFLALHLDGLQSSVEFFALVDLPDEEVAVPTVNLRVGDVDHVLVDVKVDLKNKNILVINKYYKNFRG